jgi:hypothetical protein
MKKAIKIGAILFVYMVVLFMQLLIIVLASITIYGPRPSSLIAIASLGALSSSFLISKGIYKSDFFNRLFSK